MVAYLNLISSFGITLLSLIHITYAFTFVPGTPSQCDDLSVTWTGGSPPFRLLMTPIFGTPRNVSIPSNSFSNGKGSFSTQIPFPQGQKMLLTMSDGTGFGTGGSTPVLQVGATRGGSCNTTDPGVAFPFELNTALQQCRPYTFSGYSGAIQPITIIGIIPGGTSFILNPPTGPTSFTWIDNAAASSSIVFLMEDSQGRPGGSSDVLIVASSDETSCLNNLSPSSTPGSPSPTSAPSADTTSGAPSTTATSSPSTSIGPIVGGVVGALLFLAVLLSLGLFYMKRRRPGWNFGGPGFKKNSRAHSDVDLTYDPDYISNVHPYPLPAQDAVNSSMARNLHDNDPFLDSLSPNPYGQTPVHPQSLSYQPGPTQYHSSDYHPPSAQNAHHPASQHASPRQSYPTSLASSTAEVGVLPAAVGSASSRDSMSTTQRKAAMAGLSTYKPSRFIVHTDVEDLLPLGEEEIVELPPQYSERRAPSGAISPAPTQQKNI